MSIAGRIAHLRNVLSAYNCQLIVVSKNQSPEKIQQAYDAGQRMFGENRVQEMRQKAEILPDDIKWHMIGHLQRNKVKYIAPFVSLIHAVDSLELLVEINRRAEKIGRPIACLLQLRIAREETKFGMSEQALIDLLAEAKNYPFAHIRGLMGMATFTDNQDQVRKEFLRLRNFRKSLDTGSYAPWVTLKELSMGMSADYPVALETGSTMVRIGTAVFSDS